MNNPILSSITPCYKMEKYLKLFLEELPKQNNFENIEIILDHNEPSFYEIDLVRKFQQEYPNRLKHIITDPVVPIGISMNKCISESSGEFLAIWNVDDLRTSNSINFQIKNLRNGYDISYGGFIIVDSFGKKDGKAYDHSHAFYNKEEFERGMWLGPFFAFKKELLKKSYAFDEQLITGADFDLAVRLAKIGDIGYVPEYLGYYLNEGKGSSTRGDGNQPIERTLVEMRYGILDKIEKQYVQSVVDRKYDIEHIVNYGNKISIEPFKGIKNEKI